MDPISAAGIGLSVIGLALQIFAGCIKGYQIFIEVNNVPASYQHLRVRLRIEQTRLLNWGQKIDLVADLLDQPSQVLYQNRSLILDILLEIQAVFRDCVAIENKYDNLLYKEHTEKQHVSSKQSTFDQRFPKRMEAFLSKTLSVLERTPEVPKRLQWAAIKKDEFENMIQKLIGYNNSIEALLDSTAIDQLQQLHQHTYMALLQLNTNVQELKELSMALKVQAVAGPGQVQLQASPASDKTANGGVDIARLANFKAKQMQVETQSSEVNLDPIKAEDIHYLEDSSNQYRSKAKFQDKTIWVEWKYSDMDLSLHPKWKRIIEDRVKKLVLLLQPADKPPEFNAPQCLGYFFEDDDDAEARYGFAYLKPLHAKPDAEPISLLEIIQRDRQRHPPSLSKRVALAHTVARSLMYLHSVNWIHKGLRSDNIIFFASKDHEPDLTGPPFIAGFEYARPDLPDEATEPPPEYSEHDIYRHPAIVQRTIARSQKSHDIYSLGIVLVEIAYWQHIDIIMSIPSDDMAARARVHEVRRLLLEGPFLQVVEGAVGRIYTEAVRKCLLGPKALGIPDGASESHMEVGVRMQEAFATLVVKELGDIKV